MNDAPRKTKSTLQWNVSIANVESLLQAYADRSSRESKINGVGYGLYGLGEDEILIVEGV